MDKRNRVRIRESLKSLGTRNLIAITLVFVLTLAAACAGSYAFYRSTRDNIYLQGRMNAVEAAKAFDSYLLIRENTVILAAHVVDEMTRKGEPMSDIMDYLRSESLSIQKTIDKDYTGLYGWINGEYCDGVGWVPDEDYVPTERPWYLETMADDSEITFVRPYLDEQTETVLTTMARRLSDGVSVIALDVTLGRIQVITEEITANARGSYGFVLDKTGQVIAHSDASELGKNYLEEKDTLGNKLAQKLYGEDDREFELSFGGEKYMVFVESIEGDWRMVSLVNTEVFYEPMMIIVGALLLFFVLEAIVFISILRSQSEKNLALASAEAAESASKAKTRFLSRMSHEIRTPINAIIGLNNIALRDESISARTREELNKIGASARHLLSLVNDILDMSRIESGKTELHEERFSFRDFLEEINIIVGGQCEDRGLRYIFHKDPLVEDYYVGDSLKLKQVLINILGNSVKFTDPPGEIRFSVAQTDATDDRASLRFTMEDNGIGMDSDYLPKLFDAFSQEDAGNTSRFSGSGLGMAITKIFVEMMGGEILVESEKGVGTTFVVLVSLGRVEETENPVEPVQEQPAETEDLSGLHLLIVEDQELNAEVLTDLLELEGIGTEWAENGKRGIELFEQNEAGHFDAILMDIRMPVMDGLTAARAIRSLDRPDAATIPIIALSANAFEEDVRECLEAGMNRHLSKPVDIDLLMETLRGMHLSRS